MRRWLAAALVMAAMLGAVGCTSDDGEARPSQTADGQSAPTPPPPFAGVQHALPTGEALANDPELYKNISLDDCRVTVDGWQATGNAINDTDGTLTYGILVFFTDEQARTVDSARTTVTVAPGATEPWTAAQQVTGDGIQCVIRAVDDPDSAQH